MVLEKILNVVSLLSFIHYYPPLKTSETLKLHKPDVSSPKDILSLVEIDFVKFF